MSRGLCNSELTGKIKRYIDGGPPYVGFIRFHVKSLTKDLLEQNRVGNGTSNIFSTSAVPTAATSGCYGTSAINASVLRHMTILLQVICLYTEGSCNARFRNTGLLKQPFDGQNLPVKPNPSDHLSDACLASGIAVVSTNTTNQHQFQPTKPLLKNSSASSMSAFRINSYLLGKLGAIKLLLKALSTVAGLPRSSGPPITTVDAITSAFSQSNMKTSTTVENTTSLPMSINIADKLANYLTSQANRHLIDSSETDDSLGTLGQLSSDLVVSSGKFSTGSFEQSLIKTSSGLILGSPIVTMVTATAAAIIHRQRQMNAKRYRPGRCVRRSNSLAVL
ncbi:unnamed protein product [Protopolystoma xenopodis]|uniref:Uncharacterized protein n=1 Tax=Protopolystoma xenopodis TaxID=117903 RepID=A0A3S5CC53_9PLAT|nr:unnamed protein product [Protopolystoma xenopodis]